MCSRCFVWFLFESSVIHRDTHKSIQISVFSQQLRKCIVLTAMANNFSDFSCYDQKSATCCTGRISCAEKVPRLPKFVTPTGLMGLIPLLPGLNGNAAFSPLSDCNECVNKKKNNEQCVRNKFFFYSWQGVSAGLNNFSNFFLQNDSKWFITSWYLRNFNLIFLFWIQEKLSNLNGHA